MTLRTLKDSQGELTAFIPEINSTVTADRQPPTRAEWDAATPYEQGYVSYWCSAWPGSDIPDESQCPYPQGSAEREQFDKGVSAAILAAIDSEE